MKELILTFNASIGEVGNDKLKLFSENFSKEIKEIENSDFINRNKVDVDLSNHQLFIRVMNNDDNIIPVSDLAKVSMNALKAIFVNNIVNLTFIHNEDVNVDFNVFEDKYHVSHRNIIPGIVGIGKKFTAEIDDKLIDAVIEPNYNKQREGKNDYLYYHCTIPVAQPTYENIPAIVEKLYAFTNDFKDQSVNLYRGVDSDGNQF